MKLRLASLLYTRSVLFLSSNNVGHVARLNFGAHRAQQFYTRPEFEFWPCYFCLFLFSFLFVCLFQSCSSLGAVVTRFTWSSSPVLNSSVS